MPLSARKSTNGCMPELHELSMVLRRWQTFHRVRSCQVSAWIRELALTGTHIHAHMHTHMHTRARARARTHTHTLYT